MRLKDGRKVVAVWGRVGIIEPIYKEIIKKEKEMKDKSLAWQNHEIKLAKSKMEREEWEKMQRQARKNGLCPHCGTYCYGDCGHR